MACSAFIPITPPEVITVQSTGRNRKRKSDTSTTCKTDGAISNSVDTKRTLPSPEISKKTDSTNNESNQPVVEYSDQLKSETKTETKLKTTIRRIKMNVASMSRDSKKKSSKRRLGKTKTSALTSSLVNTEHFAIPTSSSPSLCATSSTPISVPSSIHVSAPATSSTAPTTNSPVSSASTASQRQQSTGCSDDDSCLSISTSVTVVISRRASGPAAPTTTSSGNGNDVTVEAGGGSDSSRQFVVNAKIPKVSSFAITTSTDIQQPAAATVNGLAAAAESRDTLVATSNHDDVTARDEGQKQCPDALKRATGPKRKSLESVIKALKPTAVVSATSAVSDSQTMTSPSHLTNTAATSRVADTRLPPASVGESSKLEVTACSKTCNSVMDLSSRGRDVVTTPNADDKLRRHHQDNVARQPAVKSDPTAASLLPYFSGISPLGGALLTSNRPYCGHGPAAVTTECAACCFDAGTIRKNLSTAYGCVLAPSGGFWNNRSASHYHNVLNNGYDAPLELTNKRK